MREINSALCPSYYFIIPKPDIKIPTLRIVVLLPLVDIITRFHLCSVYFCFSKVVSESYWFCCKNIYDRLFGPNLNFLPFSNLRSVWLFEIICLPPSARRPCIKTSSAVNKLALNILPNIPFPHTNACAKSLKHIWWHHNSINLIE